LAAVPATESSLGKIGAGFFSGENAVTFAKRIVLKHCWSVSRDIDAALKMFCLEILLQDCNIISLLFLKKKKQKRLHV